MVNILVQVTAYVSCASCLSAIITFLYFSDLLKRLYIRLVLYISLCDLFASLLLVYNAEDGSFGCWIQGLFLNYFQLASIMWVDIVVWHLFCAVVMEKKSAIGVHIHAVGWGVPLFFMASMLSMNNIGRLSTGENYEYCWFVKRDGGPSWGSALGEISFFLVIWLSILYIICLFICILKKTGRNFVALSPHIKAALKKLSFYPVVFVVCYSLISYRFIVDALFPSSSNYCDEIAIASDVVLAAQGLFTAIIFWKSNSSILSLWGLDTVIEVVRTWGCCKRLGGSTTGLTQESSSLNQPILISVDSPTP